MVQCIGKIGTVHRITERGDIRVQYDGVNNRWTFHAGSLTKVNKYVAIYDIFVFITLFQKHAIMFNISVSAAFSCLYYLHSVLYVGYLPLL